MMLLASLLLSSPSILIIVMDDVGWKDYVSVDTPNLDAFAESGMTFTRAYAHPWCRPTRKSLLFGVWDGEGQGSMCQAVNQFTLDHEELSLPDMARTKGYATGLFGKWHLGNNDDPLASRWLTPNLNGFDTWRAGLPDNLLGPCHSGFVSYSFWTRVDDGVVSTAGSHATGLIRDALLSWWSSTSGEKLAVLSFQAAHEVNKQFPIPPSEFLPEGYTPPANPTNRDGFEALTLSLDVVIGQVVSAVHGDTIIFIVGDNGTPPNATAPLQDPQKVKHTTFEGGVHVPLFVSGPGVSSGVCASPVNMADIMPTVATLIGASMPLRDGISFQAALHGGDPPRDWTYVRTRRGNPPAAPGDDEAVIESRWKLRTQGGVEWVYDLLYDPLEVSPLDPDDPSLVSVTARLRARLAEARQ